MSLSLPWLDRLTLLVHPQRLVLERRPWRGAVMRQELAVGPAESGAAAWQPALAGAATLLESAARGAALRIVVADHFVRYALLPWSPDVRGDKARLGLARALLKNTLGDRAATLEITLDRPCYAANGIAAGLERELLAGLRAAARARRLRLHSLQPRLIVELAAHHRQLADGCFACLEPGWLTLAGLRAGNLTALRNHRAGSGQGDSPAAELAGLLAAELAAPGEGDAAAPAVGRRLFVSGRPADVPPLPEGWETTCWPPVVGGALHA